tara:strand:+ start:587 stop:874 length:288 start_codon:yes stop_codon:yes gene_type:complete
MVECCKHTKRNKKCIRKKDKKCIRKKENLNVHTVCAQITDNFPGLKDGDKWCLCALRWKEALEDGKASHLDLDSTNEKTLEYIDLDTLEKYKINK